MFDGKTLWLRAPSGARSELIETLNAMYRDVLGMELEINQTDYRDLVREISTMSIAFQVKNMTKDRFLRFPCIKEAWMLVLDDVESETWVKRWIQLGRHEIWYFGSPEEVEAFKFAMNLPKSQRAQLPDLRVTDLARNTVVELVSDEEFHVTTASKTHKFRLPSGSAPYSARDWVECIRTRELQFFLARKS
jgi:hypothetical protein